MPVITDKLILFAAISLATGKNIFGSGHAVNYFQAANSFFLMAIALFIVVYRCECNKEKGGRQKMRSKR